MRYIIMACCFALGAFLALPTLAQQAHPEPPMINMHDAEALLGQDNVWFLDVNTPEIWQQGHIPGAVWINQAQWQKLLPENRDATLIFYCANRLCLASHDAASMVMTLGYQHVFHMPDGIFGWMSSGRSIEKPADN